MSPKTEMRTPTYPFVFPPILKMLFGVFLLKLLFQTRSNLKRRDGAGEGGLGYNLKAKHLHSMHEALRSIPSPRKKYLHM